MAEWLKAADCKSARASVRWFESTPVHQLAIPQQSANSAQAVRHAMLDQIASLSAREGEAMKGLVAGKANKVIAETWASVPAVWKWTGPT